MTERFKIEVRLERREDGGLRVWSPDVPGFRLSHPNTEAVLSDIAPALREILRERLGQAIEVYPLRSMAELASGLESPPLSPVREFVTELAA